MTEAVEFSKAGYWETEGSPRRVETLTTGWEFSLDGFKTGKAVTLPHGIDEGELGFEASGCVNRQQPAWYRRRFTWSSGGRGAPALPVADGGDLVAVTATLADAAGVPKRYCTETVRFSVEGDADIVGTNPQVTRWGEAVVLIRPRAAAHPKPITIRAATVRTGKYAPAAGAITFTPGSPDVKASSNGATDDARLREVERQQHEFEAGRKDS